MSMKMIISVGKVVLVTWLCLCSIRAINEEPHSQRFDGRYNNLHHPEWGAAGGTMERNITTAYSDYTYMPSGNDRPSARQVSNAVFAGPSGNPSRFNRTALFAFFCQLVSFEVSDIDATSCPVEVLRVPVPKNDDDFPFDYSMPYERLHYDKGTGQSPNNPRRQINQASSFIDGSFIYGSNTVWANNLRTLDGTGKLQSQDSWQNFPSLNSIGLPLNVYPKVHERKPLNPYKLWKLGDPHVHENPALLSLSIVFFRYHNHIAEMFGKKHPEWGEEKLFFTTRRWVVATLQNIIMYEWLPKLLNEPIPPYTRYKPQIPASVTDVFDAGAMKYFTTLIPSGIHRRSPECKNRTREFPTDLRLCQTFWNSQEIIMGKERVLEEIIAGLATQLAENEDHQIVHDLRGKFYGPLHFSRHDYIVQIIMKGRDYGLPDYNSIRHELGLEKRLTIRDINPELFKNSPELLQNITSLYDSVDKLDFFVGGMLETSDKGPGELFHAIIKDQFLRLRDGDRFWFENEFNEIFSKEEVGEIKNITLYDVIVQAIHLEAKSLQRDVFTWSSGGPCTAPVSLHESQLETCPNHDGYDYFLGSEAAFIIIWTCFGFFPFACIFIACIIGKWKSFKYHQNVKQARKAQNDCLHIKSLNTASSSCLQISEVHEWIGMKDEPRRAEVHITYNRHIELYSMKGTLLRSVIFRETDLVTLLLSINKKRNVLLISIPKEYDMHLLFMGDTRFFSILKQNSSGKNLVSNLLNTARCGMAFNKVLQFLSENHRTSFQDHLCKLLSGQNIETSIKETKVEYIYEKAFTRQKRNELLEKFFKTVFTEKLDDPSSCMKTMAFQLGYDASRDASQIHSKQAKEIMEIELSKEEFGEALSMKPNSEFVENMFGIIDVDRNGYISFKEFLNAVILFSKGSCQEKLQTLFHMYDIDGSGGLDKDELIHMFKSLLDMAQSNIQMNEVEELVSSICQQNDLQEKQQFDFPDFCQILSPHMDNLWNANIDWKGIKSSVPSPVKTPKKVENGNKRKADNGVIKRGRSDVNTEGSRPKLQRFASIREHYTPRRAKWKAAAHYIENNKQHIFFLVLYYGICFGLFAERFYYYTVEREADGLRQMMGYGISVTRGAAGAMSFSFSLLLLTMCRNLITLLRSTVINLYIPFDSTIAFHKVVAWSALFFTSLHVIGYGFNFYSTATQPTKFLCIFDSIALRDDALPQFTFWLFGNPTGFTGVLLIFIIWIIYIFATQTARRYIFQSFWLTHKLITVLYILTIIHGASLIVQKPMFYVYFTGPAILFVIDKIVSLSRKKIEIKVLRADKMASEVTMLEFKRPPKFEYKSGQWVRIASLACGRNEYHPFTLTSAPHEDTLTLHIRALGPWTWNIRQIYDPENCKDGSYPNLYLDGPYGAGQQDWYQYDVSVLVGAGIGVTPYASILKDFVHMSAIKNTYNVRCQKGKHLKLFPAEYWGVATSSCFGMLYFIWVTGSQRQFEWLIDILREVEEIDEKGVCLIDIFITQFFQNFDLRTSMLYICEDHFQKMHGGRSVFTGLRASTHFGRPLLSDMMQTVHKSHPLIKKIGVFSCGPPGLTKGVERACVETSKTTKAMFEHHFENF